jgi:hypothetical protein
MFKTNVWLIAWLICSWVRDLTVPMHLGLSWQALWEPCCFAKVPDDPQTYTVDVLWLQEEGAQIHMFEWSQSFTLTKNVADVSSSAPHLLHNGLSDSPIRWRCLLRVLCPVRRPVTALYYVLLKDSKLALAPREGPEINSRACLWVSPRPRHHNQCWLTNQRLILLHISCLETPKAGSGPTNFRAELFLASSSAISFPCAPACRGVESHSEHEFIINSVHDINVPTCTAICWHLTSYILPNLRRSSMDW